LTTIGPVAAVQKTYDIAEIKVTLAVPLIEEDSLESGR